MLLDDDASVELLFKECFTLYYTDQIKYVMKTHVYPNDCACLKKDSS